jgi:hypothetical protein
MPQVRLGIGIGKAEPVQKGTGTIDWPGLQQIPGHGSSPPAGTAASSKARKPLFIGLDPASYLNAGQMDGHLKALSSAAVASVTTDSLSRIFPAVFVFPLRLVALIGNDHGHHHFGTGPDRYQAQIPEDPLYRIEVGVPDVTHYRHSPAYCLLSEFIDRSF